MAFISEFKGNNVAVFGLGRAGHGAVQLLLDNNTHVYAWDDNEVQCSNLKSEIKNPFLHVSPPETYDWKSVKALVLSPGVPLTYPKPHMIVNLANGANVPIICDIELLYKSQENCEFIGITGTNGKSTTTALIGHIFGSSEKPVEVGGNIGISAAGLKKMSKGTYVLEVSSYQLDLMHETHFDVSVLLNITPDHIDRHGSMEGYINAKKRIFQNQTHGNAVVIGIDEPNTKAIYEEMLKRKDIRLIPISHSTPCKGIYFEGNVLINAIHEVKRYDLGDLPRLPGLHNRQNIAAGFAASIASGIPENKIIKAVKSFEGLKHRIQRVAEIEGVTFINDSKATNAEAAEKAILCYNNIYLILGGVAKEGGIESLLPLSSRIANNYLIGKATEEFASSLEGKMPYTKADNLENAVRLAFEDAKKSNKPNPVVLLSPACASFDQFKNFEERGDKFIEYVGKLIS